MIKQNHELLAYLSPNNWINQIGEEAYLITNKIRLGSGAFPAENLLTYDYAYSGYAAGYDDGFRIDISTDWRIKPLMNPESFVYTNPPDTWKTLLNQRIRWASTGKDYAKLSVRIYLTLIYLTLLSFILGLCKLSPGYFVIMWGVKLLVDIPVAILVTRTMHQQKLLFAFPLVYILQPFIVVIATFLGILRLYRWK